MQSKEVQHSGILGMRWGRRNGPPYPLGKADMSRRAWNKLSPEEKAARAEGEKQYLLKSGTAQDVATKLRGHLTNQEYADVLKRLDYEQKLSEVQARTKNPNWIKAERMIEEAQTVHKGFNAAADIYNDIARVTNIGGDGLPLLPDAQRINALEDDKRRYTRERRDKLADDARRRKYELEDAERRRKYDIEDDERRRTYTVEDNDLKRQYALEDDKRLADRKRTWDLQDDARDRSYDLADEARRRKYDLEDEKRYRQYLIDDFNKGRLTPGVYNPSGSGGSKKKKK